MDCTVFPYTREGMSFREVACKLRVRNTRTVDGGQGQGLELRVTERSDREVCEAM